MFRHLCAALFAFGSLAVAVTRAEDWPTWRGPDADGICHEKNLPTTWSAQENVKWKAALPGPGNSTPIILGDRIFITQAKDKGQQRGVMCFDRMTGQEKWSQFIPFEGNEPTHGNNPYCSASLATDGKSVFAWHGSAGVVAYDLDGKLLWQQDLGKFTHMWGNAGSPVVYQDLLILHCGPGERVFVVALRTKDGSEAWRIDGVPTEQGTGNGSWGSPLIIRDGERDALLIDHPFALVAYQPKSGQELWRCEGLTEKVYSTPISSEGIAVAMSGYGGKALAVKLGGQGNVTDTHRLWITPNTRKEDQRIGSGIILKGHIYMVNEPGMAQCIKLDTGEQLWKERLGGRTWSNLVLADGNFYNVDQDGTTSVFPAQPVYSADKVIANKLDEQTNASIAISQGNLYIRTYEHLWCIGR